MEGELRPRLCFLLKGSRGYGFHLHGERNKGGQFIRRVEPGSSAELGGLRAGDRVVEVNGENVEQEPHHQVVSRIRAVDHRTRLLVVDRETDEFLRARGLACTEQLAVEMGTLSPRPSPLATPCASPLPRDTGMLPPPHTPPPTPGTVLQAELSVEESGEMLEESGELLEASGELVPRLCVLRREEGGFGFNLHSDKTRRAQVVRSVEPGSPAERAGLRPGDCLLEVDGQQVGGLRHQEVVSLIRGGQRETSLLVMEPQTHQLLLRLDLNPTSRHTKAVYVDGPITDYAPPAPHPISEHCVTHPPMINITSTDSPTKSDSPKSRTNGSSASQSSGGSTTVSEFSDISIPVAEEDERRVSDPFLQSGLRLSPTAAEAAEKLRSNRSKKRAPPMDWSRKQQVFSNF